MNSFRPVYRWLAFFGACVVAYGLAKLFGACQRYPTSSLSLEAMHALKNKELVLYMVISLGVPAFSYLVPCESKPQVDPTPGRRPWVWLASHVFYWLLIPGVLFFALPRPTAHRALDMVDDGILLASAHDSLYGKLPYRDIYFHYGPLREITQTRIAFKLFGDSLEGLRHFYWYLDPIGPLVLYFLALVIVRRRWVVLLMPLVFLGRLDVSLLERHVLPAISLLGVILAERYVAHRKILLGLSGFFLMLAYFYSMEGGVLIGVAMGLYFLLKGREGLQNGLAVAVGALGVLVPGFLWLVFHGLLGEFVTNAMLGGKFLAAAGKPAFALCQPLTDFLRSPTTLWGDGGAPIRLWVPVFLYMVGLLTSVPAVRLMSLAGIMHFVMALGRSDYHHWLAGTPFLWTMIPLLLDRSVDGIRSLGPVRSWRLPSGVIAIVLVIFTLGLVRYSVLHADPWLAWSRVLHAQPVRSPAALLQSPVERLGRVPALPADVQEMETVVDRVNRWVPPGRPIYVFTDDSIFYFLANRPNATRYPVAALVWDDASQAEVLNNLRQRRPDCIIARGSAGRIRCLAYLKPIARYIETEYRLREKSGNLLFFVPR